ncbi:hypothetical protein [uncultured Vibrio sp.]|uniref:hypothetical protein n=1 Tax=uncultured Vibrio sp. TaxID=114054 RepID=UPI0025DC8E7F|nr:hypothetical protein [uncultured Vibrio sp.]
MRKKIEFNRHAQSISKGIYSLGGTFIGCVVAMVVFKDEFHLFSLLLPIIITIVQYGFIRIGVIRQDSNSRLTVRDGDIYLHGLIAALRYRNPTLGRPYIRVTSITKSGYYRIKVYQSWVTPEEWQLLLSQCT